MVPPKDKDDFEMEDSGGEDDGHDELEILGESSKSSSSSQVRKAQNRIAQREFRLRKQQYIRDLEARVEVLSGDKEERIELMTLLVRNLLKENKELRGMVKTIAGFIGEGLGSCLPRLGLSAEGLDAILNRSDTDTAYEAFVNLKASKEQTEDDLGARSGETRKRANTTKRKRLDDEAGATPTLDKGKGKARNGMSMSASGNATPIISDSSLPFYNFSSGQGDDYHYLFPDLDTLLSGNSITPFGKVSAISPQPIQQSVDESESFDSRQFPDPLGPPFEDRRQHGYARNIMPSELGGSNSPKGQNRMLPPVPTISGESSLPPENLGYYGYPTSSEHEMVGTSGGLGGFGLTIPIPLQQTQSQNPLGGSNPTGGTSRIAENSMNSLAGPRFSPGAMHSQGNYASGHPSILQSGSNHTDAERQQTLRDAVSTITNVDNPLKGPGVTAAELAERRRQQDQLMKIIEDGDPADRKMETMQLITYHLNNFRINHEYHLPPSLRPTVVQRTIPHEHAIDGIIFPSVRDRMILLRGRYDLVEVFRAMLTDFDLHGDDALDHNNYEVSEKFIENYSILIDDMVINISNKWRNQRGLPPLGNSEQRSTDDERGGNRIHAAHADSYTGNQPNK